MRESCRRARRPRQVALGAVLSAALAGGLVPGLAGCAKFDSALGKQWATVNFKADTSIATVLRVRAACSHVPNVHPAALPRQQTAATMPRSLTYRTDSATDANLAQLQQCLQRFPSVQGISFQDAGDGG